MSKNRIIPQMFDIKPVDETGDLDWKKINKLDPKLIQKEEIFSPYFFEKNENRNSEFQNQEKNKERYFPCKQTEVYRLGERYPTEHIPIFQKTSFIPRNKINFQERSSIEEEIKKFQEQEYLNYQEEKLDFSEKESKKIKENFRFSDLFIPSRFAFNFNPKKSSYLFAGFALIIALTVGIFSFGSKGFNIKGKVLGTSQDGYDSLKGAIQETRNQNFEASQLAFAKAYENFSSASDDLDEMGKVFIEVSRFFPFSSKLSSGKNMLEAGKHISTAGQSLNKIIKKINSVENPLSNSQQQSEFSFLEIFRSSEKEIKIVSRELKEVEEHLDKVSINDLPEDKQKQFLFLKEKLPEIIRFTDEFLKNSEIFTELLGGNGPRKYLFLFQNNQEMRATGGFIGSYGLLDISNGRIRNFFIDGIFNPDGQLQEKIIPPKPIQKISAAWSLHDSNWFPDFPTSAEKAIVFFEKTGGPTVDGVITLTPTVMQELLKITGPIEMNDYGVTINSENFIEKTQYEVEVNYDKEENRPKKILSELAPIILDRIFNSKNVKSVTQTIEALSSGLSQKQILLYSSNNNLQKIISNQGWSGEMLSTQKDYLSVINSNINGYKTDGVIEESISHEAEIQDNGTVIDTVTINRKHNGGNFSYEWWNKVNSDYLRVYVPLGSKLLSVEGQTREFNKSPIDYKALGFKNDPLVEKEENGMEINEETGTRTYEENGKTVFANWTYVSPKETMTIKYKYLLPFRVDVSQKENPAGSYSLLAQKQSGSLGSKFLSKIIFPKNYTVNWSYPENMNADKRELTFDSDLKVDRFIGLVFTQEGIYNSQL